MGFNVIGEIANRANSTYGRQMWFGISLQVIESSIGTIPLLLAVYTVTELWQGAMLMDQLWEITGYIFFAFLLQFFILWWSVHVTFSAGYRITGDLRLALADHIRKLPLGYFSRRHTGDLTSIVSDNVQMAEEIFTHLLSVIAGGIARSAVILAALFFYSWQIGAIMLASIPLGLLFFSSLRGFFEKLARAKADETAETSSQLLEFIQGIKLIRVFGLTADKFSKLDQSLQRLRDYSIKIEAVGSLAVVGFTFFIEAAFIIILLYGFHLFGLLEISLPVLIGSLFLAYAFYAPIIDLIVFIAQASYIRRNMDRIDDILMEKPLKDAEDPKQLNTFPIKFDQVSFSYDNDSVSAIKNVSFDLPEGSMTAIVGASGAGKTTLMSLILRFYDESSGRISIDDVPISDIAIEDLNQNITTVFQDIYLFQDTILANLKIGKPDADMNEVIKVAKAAQANDFIMDMPDGYHTMVGEGGMSLSGGEKQRIAIARALLKDSPIMLLDEATSSIDVENEVAIQNAIAQLIEGKTTLIIAHRLASIMRADQILVMDGGQIVERGTHEELLNSRGVYYRLWDASGIQ